MCMIFDLIMLMCIQLKPVGIGRLFDLNADVDYCGPAPRSSSADNSLCSLLSKLIRGQLIYPWI